MQAFIRYGLAVASAAAGALLGAVVQTLATSELSIVSGIAIVVSLGLIAQYAYINYREKETEESNRRVLQKVISEGVASRTALEQLERQVGIQVRYQLAETMNLLTSYKEDLLAQEVERATSEVLVLDLLTESGRRPDMALKHELLIPYYALIMTKIEGGLAYRRICQTISPSLPLNYMQDAPFRDHCRDVSKFREENQRWDSSIRLASNHFPYKFLIIDRKAVIIQLHTTGASGFIGDQNYYCDVLISDPSGSLVSVFMKMWDSVLEAYDTRIVKSEELVEN